MLRARTGVGRYTYELLRALGERGLEPIRYAVSLSAPSVPEVVRWKAPARLMQASWRRLGGPSIERLTGPVDIVHATNFVLPALKRAAGIVTVHDLSYLRSDTFPGGHRLRALVPWSLARAAAAIVPTAAVKVELCDRYDFEEQRVFVTPEGVSPAFFGATPLAEPTLSRMGIRRPFALAVGTLEPRKNLGRLLQAWERAGLSGWTLALAGPRGWGRDLPETPGVVPLGYVGDETLPGLLAAAEMFCYPSLYEGFGLPPLEAMAAGAPAIVGDYAAAREVVGEAAVVVDATDLEAVADALRQIAGDEGLRHRLTRDGRARAALFSWSDTARTTLEAYQAAAPGEL